MDNRENRELLEQILLVLLNNSPMDKKIYCRDHATEKAGLIGNSLIRHSHELRLSIDPGLVKQITSSTVKQTTQCKISNQSCLCTKS